MSHLLKDISKTSKKGNIIKYTKTIYHVNDDFITLLQVTIINHPKTWANISTQPET